MASAELAHFPLTAQALVARLPLLTQLADFQRALNEQFDTCRHAERYRPGAALRRLRAGVELLCNLQQDLLHPALAASWPVPWPALQRAMDGAAELRQLVATGDRADDAQQRAVLALIEGLVQLQFSSLDELLGEADPNVVPWGRLASQTQGLLDTWPLPAALSSAA